VTQSFIMCLYLQCPYPFGLTYSDTFINHDFMTVVKDGDILDRDSHSESGML
jgi:hypothetical protein